MKSCSFGSCDSGKIKTVGNIYKGKAKIKKNTRYRRQWLYWERCCARLDCAGL